MSRIFTLFPTTYNEAEKAIDAVNRKDIRSLRLYNGNLSYVHDSQRNNLLHLATLHEDVDSVKYLLEKNVLRNECNIFSLTPLDYAIRSHNQKIIKLYFSDDIQIETLKKEAKELASSNDLLQTEVTVLRRGNKRLREENDELQMSNKRLKRTVDSLTDAMKQKN